jgi:peptidoglycan/LPS O-acetylase OafA/YrhL
MTGLVALAAGVILLPQDLRSFGGALGASSLFLTNAWFAATGVYFQPASRDSPLLHLWSLAVEEQFYLLWPTVVKRITIRTLLWVCLTLCVVEPGLRLFNVTHHTMLGNTRGATYLIADNLALGGLAAIFARSTHGTLRNGIMAGSSLCVLGLGIFVVGYPFGIMHRTNVVGGAFQQVPWNLCFAGALLLCLGLRSPWFSSAWARPLAFFGYISYGLYLIHGFVFGMYYRTVSTSFRSFAVATTIAILIAWISRRFYEEHFLRLGR